MAAASLRPRPNVYPLIAVAAGVVAAVGFGAWSTGKTLADRHELNRGRGDAWNVRQAQPFECEVRVAGNDDKKA